MVLFHQAVFALLFASNAVGSSIRSLQNTYEIDVPTVCYYDGIATSDAVCDTGSTTFSLPDGHVPGVPSLVTIWPHDDVTGYGTIDQDYYAGGCTDLLIPLQQALFPPPADPDVNEDATGTNVFSGGGVALASSSTTHKPAISIYSFPLTFLDSLPNQLVSVTGDVTTVTFCQRFQLFQTSSGSELGFREADITVIYDVDGTTSLNVQINDIDPTTPSFDLGDYSIIAQRCDDDTDPTNDDAVAVTQGTPVEICLYPVKDLDDTTDPSADRTTDIIIRRVEDFTFTVGTVQQAAFSGGVKADETSVAAADGNACAEGLGEPDFLSTSSLAGLHGCEFSTLLDAAFYDTDTAAAGAAVTAATTGLVTIEFRGARRKLQVFGAGDQATLATNGISLLLREEEKTEDGACSDWWFIFRWICEIWVFIFGS